MAGRDHRAVGGERVGGRAERRGRHHAVAGEADVALAVDLDLDRDLAGARAHEHEVVDRAQRSSPSRSTASAGSVPRPPLAGGDAVERVLEPVGGRRGQRAEAAAGDAEHGAADGGGGVEGGERRPVAAERDREVAVGRARRAARPRARRRRSAPPRRPGAPPSRGSSRALRRARAGGGPRARCGRSGRPWRTNDLIVGRHGRPAEPRRCAPSATRCWRSPRSARSRTCCSSSSTRARELAGARYAALGTPDGEGGFTRFLVAGMSDELIASLGPLPRTHGCSAAMLETAEPYLTADIHEHPRFRGWWPSRHPGHALVPRRADRRARRRDRRLLPDREGGRRRLRRRRPGA